MRWFVTGSGGQLGSALLARLAADPAHRVMGARHAQLDVSDADAVAKALDAAFEEPPDVVANAAAYTDVDGCERNGEQAERVNARAPGVLAELCRARGARLVHVSTDYVFDGRARDPYDEQATPRPLSAYGRSKLEGEQAALSADPGALVVRTAWLYGRGRNFVAAVCRRALEPGAQLRVVDDQAGSPTYAEDLAEGLVALLEAGASGLYHLANAGAATRFELARAALDHAGLAGVPIARIRTEDLPLPARRPAWSVLDCAKAERAGVRLRAWGEALAAYLDSDASPLRAAEAEPRPGSTDTPLGAGRRAG